MKNKAKKMGFAVLTSAAMLTTVLTANAQSSKVFIDPGHGGFDNGSSYLGNLEDELNLQIANKVAKKLKNRGISVNMSRTNDTYVGLGQRALMSNSSDANVFISIHQNASENSNVSGIETYYLKDSGINLAKSIHSKVIGYTGASNRKIRKANFQVLRENNVTAILIECGFISNKYEGYNLSTDAYQEKIANGIVEGVVDYLNNNKGSTENKATNITNKVESKANIATALMDNIVIRSDMKTDSEVMGALNIGDTVEVVETKFDWHKIKFGNGYAYVSAVYVK